MSKYIKRFLGAYHFNRQWMGGQGFFFSIIDAIKLVIRTRKH